MEEKTKFFEAKPGNRSSSRLMGFIIVCAALLLSYGIVYLGRDNVIQAATAAGTIFITIGGPALAYLFGQKYNERKTG